MRHRPLVLALVIGLVGLSGCAGRSGSVRAGDDGPIVRGQTPPEAPPTAAPIEPIVPPTAAPIEPMARPGAAPGGPFTRSPVLSREDRDETPEYPELHADPLELSDVPPAERDPLLVPWLSNLLVQDLWDLNRDPLEARNIRLAARAQRDIRRPAPDTANFPNAAYTLPKGRVYLETSPVGFYGRSTATAPQYNWEFLLRYGVTDNLEFRIFSNGLTVQGDPGSTTGFSPLAFDFKVNFWEENRKYFVPAFGMEVYLETDLGSPAFNGGTQPSVNILFDQTILYDIQLEYNFSISGIQAASGLNEYTFGFQWSLQRTVFEDFDVFVHGFYNATALPRLPKAQSGLLDLTDIPETTVIGGGAIWTLSDRLAVFGSYNAGLNQQSPATIALLGFAIAF